MNNDSRTFAFEKIIYIIPWPDSFSAIYVSSVMVFIFTFFILMVACSGLIFTSIIISLWQLQWSNPYISYPVNEIFFVSTLRPKYLCLCAISSHALDVSLVHLFICFQSGTNMVWAIECVGIVGSATDEKLFERCSQIIAFCKSNDVACDYFGDFTKNNSLPLATWIY